MAKVKALVSIKYEGKWYQPGTTSSIFEMDEEMATILSASGKVEYANPQAELSDTVDAEEEAKKAAHAEIIAELCEVDEVTAELAEGLIAVGLTSIESLQVAKESDLTRIKGLTKAIAKKIIDSANTFEIEQ